jgi:hypothetical protein
LVALADLGDTLAAPGELTLLAPANSAFSALPVDFMEFIMSPEGLDTLIEILMYSVIPGIFVVSELDAAEELTTAQGGFVTVSLNPLRFNQAGVVEVDILANNGVVHKIDSVLIPATVVGFLGFPTGDVTLDACEPYSATTSLLRNRDPRNTAPSAPEYVLNVLDAPRGFTATFTDDTSDFILGSPIFIAFTPVVDGTSTVTFEGTGDITGTQSVSLTFIVSNCPDNPDVANNDVASTTDSRAVSIDVLANDVATSSATKTVTAVATPSKGGASSFTAAGVVYTPLRGFTGVETFEYTATLGDSTELMATVTVTVGNAPEVSFAIPNQISTASAIGLVRDGLYADSSLKAGDLTALLNPVTFTGSTNDFFSKASNDALNSLRGGGGGF